MNSEAKRDVLNISENSSGFSLRLCASARNITFQIAAIFVCLLIPTSFASPVALQERSLLRVAVIGFTQKATNYDERSARLLEDALADSLKTDSRISMIEKSMSRPALTGVGYDGSINLSMEEARRIGAAIGCDFFITGKAENVARSESKGDYIEAIVGVMIVDGRSGDLAYFDFIEEKAATDESALSKAATALSAGASLYAQRMSEWREKREFGTLLLMTHPTGQIEEIPEEGSARSAGFKPPEFLNRVRPEYTSQADRADISARVEASAVFHADGKVDQIEITRWAGFGLDQSAIAAIQKLKFKPATRNDKPVSVRATVQYNFRRVEK